MVEPKDSLEKALIEMAQKGLLELPITDELVAAFESQEVPEDLSVEEFRRLYETARQTWQDLAIEKAKRSLSEKVVPFGTLLRLVREHAGLNLTEMAYRIKKDAAFLDGLETNLVNPLEVETSTVCDVIEAFHLTVSEFLRSVQESLILLSQMRGSIRTMARSPLKPGTKDREKSLAQAADALLIEKAKKEGASPAVPEHFLDQIRQELRGRGRLNLLV